jgi:hypothetical protein
MSIDQDDTLDRLDVALIPLKAALNMVPIVGGSLASLIADGMARFQQEAMKKAAEFLRQKVEALENRIDTDAVNKDDFAELFGKYAALAATTGREEKLRAASNILANALLPPGDPNKSPFDELDHLMHCVGALSSGAIAFLGASMEAVTQSAVKPNGRRFSFLDITFKLRGTDPDVVMGLASELRSFNLLHITEGLIGGHNPKNYGFEVTPVGERFARRFIEGRM